MPPSTEDAHRTLPSRWYSGDAVTPAFNSVTENRDRIMPPDGKFEVMGGTWDQEAHFLADQVLEVRVRAGQPHFLRRPKILDPEDLPPSMMDALGWEEE